MLTPADLRTYAPELADLSDGTLQQWIDMAGVMVKPAPWGENYDFALKALAAHYAVVGLIQSTASTSGVVASEKVGDIQRSFFKTNLGDADDLASTAYGSMYAQLKRTLVTGPYISNGTGFFC